NSLSCYRLKDRKISRKIRSSAPSLWLEIVSRRGFDSHNRKGPPNPGRAWDHLVPWSPIRPGARVALAANDSTITAGPVDNCGPVTTIWPIMYGCGVQM